MSVSRSLAAILVLAAAAAFAEDIPPLLRGLDSDDAAVRASTVEEVRKSPDRDALVVRALRDGEARSQIGTRGLAALADLAGEYQLRSANGGLRALVADASADLDVRRAAARALGRTGTTADASVLGDALPVIPDEAVRALVAIGGHTAVLAIRRGGGETPPLEAAAGLALLGDRSGLPRLVAALEGPDAARAASLLTWATGHDFSAGRASGVAYLRRSEIASRFSDLDNDKSGDAVDAMAAKLRSGEDGGLVEDLVEILKDPAWPAPARDKAALVLGLGGVRSAKDTLLWACRDGEVGSVRMYAADALARVGDLSAAPALVAMLNNDEDKDRIAGRRAGEGDFFPVDPCFIRALYRLGCRGACDRAIELLAGEYRTRLHRDCLRALGELSGGRDFGFEPDASKPERRAAVDRIRVWWREARETVKLAPRPDDPGWDAFRKAVAENIEALGGFKFLYQMRAKNLLVDLAEPAMPQLVAALADEREHVRMGVADVLAAAALREPAAALVKQLGAEQKPAVRTRLLAALEVCGRNWPDGRPAAGPELAQAVRGCLGDPSLDVRIAAARTLGIVGTLHGDAGRLTASLAEGRNGDPAFRFAASAALLHLARRAALPEIVAYLRSDDVALRAEGARHLLAAGWDLKGYDPDLAPEEREAAVRRIEETLPAGLSSVPYRERK